MAKNLDVIVMFACDKEGLIGRNGTLPWDFPEDLAHFKETTSGEGKALLMGYNTWKSLPVGKTSGEKLVGRKKFVLTKKTDLKSLKNTMFINSPEITELKRLLLPVDITKLYVIGGAQTFKAFHYLGTEHLISLINRNYGRDIGDVRVDMSWYKRVFNNSTVVKTLHGGEITVHSYNQNRAVDSVYGGLPDLLAENNL